MEHADSDTNIKQSKSNHLAWSEGFDFYLLLTPLSL
jgi:hypothetical protein